MNRKEAILANSLEYTPTKPCKQGHLSDKYVKTRTCKECNKLFARKARADDRNPKKARKAPPIKKEERVNLDTWRRAVEVKGNFNNY